MMMSTLSPLGRGLREALAASEVDTHLGRLSGTSTQLFSVLLKVLGDSERYPAYGLQGLGIPPRNMGTQVCRHTCMHLENIDVK
jgi:hypothetical protein